MAETLREEALDLARQYVTNDRNSNYGDPEDNFKIIADIEESILQHRYGPDAKFDSLDVVFQALSVKLGRLAHNPLHLDSWIDIIGYAACAYEIAVQQQERNDEFDEIADMLDTLAVNLDLFPLVRAETRPSDVADTFHVYVNPSFLTEDEQRLFGTEGAGEQDAS